MSIRETDMHYLYMKLQRDVLRSLKEDHGNVV